MFSFPVHAQVVNSSANVRVVEGRTVVLVCTAEGFPTPHVVWIAPNGTVLQNRTTGTNLIFTNVSRHSSGTYRCNASNELQESHSVTTNLIVWCKYFLLCVCVCVCVCLKWNSTSLWLRYHDKAVQPVLYIRQLTYIILPQSVINQLQ